MSVCLSVCLSCSIRASSRSEIHKLSGGNKDEETVDEVGRALSVKVHACASVLACACVCVHACVITGWVSVCVMLQGCS